MKTLEMSNKKLTVKIHMNGDTQKCIASNGDIKYFDDGLLLKTFSDLKLAKKTGIFEFFYRPLTEQAYKEIITRDEFWLKKQNSNTLNGGVFTMLKNKGYDN